MRDGDGDADIEWNIFLHENTVAARRNGLSSLVSKKLFRPNCRHRQHSIPNCPIVTFWRQITKFRNPLRHPFLPKMQHYEATTRFFGNPQSLLVWAHSSRERILAFPDFKKLGGLTWYMYDFFWILKFSRLRFWQVNRCRSSSLHICLSIMQCLISTREHTTPECDLSTSLCFTRNPKLAIPECDVSQSWCFIPTPRQKML